jgi:hypothetical protein
MTDAKDDVLKVAEYFNGLTLYSPDSQMVPAAMSHVRVTLPIALAMQECIRSMADRLTTLTRERDALTMHMNQVHGTLGGTDTVLTLEAAQRVVFERDALKTQLAAARVCKWREDDPDFGTWRTGCGHLWSFNAGGPKENDAKFCQYCGGALDAALTAAITPEDE